MILKILWKDFKKSVFKLFNSQNAIKFQKNFGTFKLNFIWIMRKSKETLCEKI